MQASKQAVQCSVVVPTFRGSRRLPKLLTSLTTQSYAGEWEIVIALDGEDQETRQVVESYADALPIRIVVNPVAQGVASAMNLGTAAAVGRIVIRCDDDLLLPEHFISRHMAHHDSPNMGVISATRDVFPPENVYGRTYGGPANLRALRATYNRAQENAWIAWAACNSVERTKLVAVGGFNPNLPYGEDSELGYRLQASGVTIVCDEMLEVEHLSPAFGLETRIPRAFISGASKKAFRALHPGVLPAPQTPSGSSARAWGALTKFTTAILSSRERCTKVGRLVSPLLNILPQKVTAKMIALLVESAALAGARYGSEDITVYKAQKNEDIERERG